MRHDASNEIHAEGVLPGYPIFQAKFKQLTGIDLTHYKQAQTMRRLTGYLARVEEKDFFGLARRIEQNEEELLALRDYLMINVSEFFRNPDRFEVLASDIIPKLRQEFGPLRIWSAGTSVGAEAYSIAMIMTELGWVAGDEIIATDVDRGAIQEAKAGVYREDMLKEVSKQRRLRHFKPDKPGYWRVNDAVKSLVRFEVHDLMNDPYPQNVHLILCRNVLIYFTDAAKDRIYKKFSESLEPGGYLLIGSTESIFSARAFHLESAGLFLYRRRQS